MTTPTMKNERQQKCANCGGDIAVRNPTGKCDHLYYPDNVTLKVIKNEPQLSAEQKKRLMEWWQTDEDSDGIEFFARELAQERERVVEEVEFLRKRIPNHRDGQYFLEDELNYNQALDDVLTQLKGEVK